MKYLDNTWTVTVLDGATNNTFQIELHVPHGDPTKWTPHNDGHIYSDDYTHLAQRLGQAARDCLRRLVDKRQGHS